MIKSLSDKLIIRFCLVVDVDEFDHAVIVQFTGVVRSQYLRLSACVKAALHTVNIDFELNYITFIINFYNSIELSVQYMH